jgi:hypothetical protein
MLATHCIQLTLFHHTHIPQSEGYGYFTDRHNKLLHITCNLGQVCLGLLSELHPCLTGDRPPEWHVN